MPACQTNSFSAFWFSYNSQKISQSGMNDFSPTLSLKSAHILGGLWPLGLWWCLRCSCVKSRRRHCHCRQQLWTSFLWDLARGFSPAPDHPSLQLLQDSSQADLLSAAAASALKWPFKTNPCLEIKTESISCFHRRLCMECESEFSSRRRILFFNHLRHGEATARL